MKRDPRWALVLALAAFCFTLLMVETATRSFVTPAADSYGSLFGLELPPLELPSYTTPPPAVDRNAWYQGLIVEGKRITIGDLWGFFREDPILGYAPRKT